MDSKEICLKILAANSEAAVQGIIDSVPEMNNQKNWRPLNGRETNFNIVSNQASTGGKALTELMTNMVDAVLMKLAYQQGVDPKSVSAPQTMYEAVDRLAGFIGLRGGRIVDVDDEKDLRKFAEKNLIIGVTGPRALSTAGPATPLSITARDRRPRTSSGHSCRCRRATRRISPSSRASTTWGRLVSSPTAASGGSS